MRALANALARLLRPDQHIVLRLVEAQPITVSDLLSVPRSGAACERVPGCCDDWPAKRGRGSPA